MERLTLFEEYRLIERSETEVNGAWKGAHLLLFFMAFVFGSFCTFCFHMLMYLFDEKCVLFPKLLSLTSLRHNVIYEFLPLDKESADMLPLDFVGTQWVEKSACYLPTYVPLISGIFGLVWTTMFLMCSTGTRTLTGLQRTWRVLPPVFLFSVAMALLCIYSSSVTHNGLNALCSKLGEITGSATCTYTVNVATLAYERRIRGVYQAIRLTILSAWLHTACWLLSALLTLARVILAVDFQLVRVTADLIGSVDRMMEHHEKQIRTVSPEPWQTATSSSTSVGRPSHVRFRDRPSMAAQTSTPTDDIEVLYQEDSDILYQVNIVQKISQRGLFPEESHRLARKEAMQKVPEDKQFIVKMLYDLIHTLPNTDSDSTTVLMSSDTSTDSDVPIKVCRQLGLDKIITSASETDIQKGEKKSEEIKPEEAEKISREIKRKLQRKHAEIIRDAENDEPIPSTHRGSRSYHYDSVLNITEDMKNIIEQRKKQRREMGEDVKDEETQEDNQKDPPKSSFKNSAVQTDTARRSQQKVQISEPESDRAEENATNTNQDVEKETQTNKEKEKQD